MTPDTSTGASFSADPFALHWSLYPRHYVAPRAPEPLVIDGDINKPAWEIPSWSVPFDEIRGEDDAPPSTRPPKSCTTRIKMLWDDNYLYVSALIESDFTVIADYTHRNDPIFQVDSDFEVFINPSGSTHDYKELELNAINTVWNLMLDKPYDDGGVEHSGRIAKPNQKNFFEVHKQKTAARVVKGKIGDPKGATWAVELALAHSDTLSHDPRGRNLSPPKVGDKWRINFSRVEHQGDTNWTWQAQRIWDPILGRVAGKVAMHLPDAWGYVEFGPSDATTTGDRNINDHHDMAVRRDPTWPERLACMNIYYAQRRYSELHEGQFAPDLDSLDELVDPAILKPFLVSKNSISIVFSNDNKGYTASVTGPTGTKATVTNERLLIVDHEVVV